MLAGEGLTLWRGTTLLFEELGFRVAAGEALLVEGPNGAGKTSLLRVVAGLTNPDAGTLTWDGELLRNRVAAGTVRVAYAGHALALKAELTARSNLRYYARVAGTDAEVDDVLEATGTASYADLEVRTLSAGQKRRVALGRLLLSGAELWLLDEPQTNLDSAGRAYVEAAIRTHLQRGHRAVIAAHQAMDLGQPPPVQLRLGDA